MLDHVTLGVSDIERSRKFYDQALRPLGIERLYAEGEVASGYGANPYDTYTWELHTDPEGERELKRAHVIDRPKQDGEAFNPYDTGKFSGGW